MPVYGELTRRWIVPKADLRGAVHFASIACHHGANSSAGDTRCILCKGCLWKDRDAEIVAPSMAKESFQISGSHGCLIQATTVGLTSVGAEICERSRRPRVLIWCPTLQ